MHENRNFEKRASQNMVAIETSNCLDQEVSYHVMPDKFETKSQFLVAFASILKKLITRRV